MAEFSPARQVLTAGAGITLTDGGAGSTVTVAQPNLPTYANGTYLNSGFGQPIFPGGYASGVMHLGPLYLPSSRSIDRIAANVGNYTAGTLRLGAYTLADGVFARLFDAGTIDLTTARAGKEIVVNQTLPSGWVWLAALYEGVTIGSGNGVVRNTSTHTSWPFCGFAPNNLNYSGISGFSFSGVTTGSLPATQTITPASPEMTNVHTVVAVRLA